MKDFEKLLIQIANDFVDDYSLEGLIDELFPGITGGELILEMYRNGMIPEDVLEKFLSE